MSFFGRLRQAKTSSSQERKSHSSGDGIKNASGEKKGSSETEASLFSGMTLTTSPATEMAGELSFTGDSDRDLMSTKQGTKSTGINANRRVNQDVSTVLDMPGSEVLPEPIQPIPVNALQQAGHSAAAKKKKTRQTVRPGYARQSDSKTRHITEQSEEVQATEMSCESVEKGGVMTKQDVENSKNIIQPEESASALPAPVYSIGTPSSSDENLYQDVETHSDTGNLIPISSDLTSHSMEVPTKEHENKETQVFRGDSREENMEGDTDHEMSTPSVKDFDDSLHAAERTDYNLQGDKLSSLFETCVVLDESPKLPGQNFTTKSETGYLQAELASKEELIQNEEHDELHELERDLVSDVEMEISKHGADNLSSFNLIDKPGESSDRVKSKDELSIALHQMESQLATLSDDKQSLRSLEEELFKLYTDTEGTISEKKQQIKKLQQEESQALANDNYDLAEEISSRLEQLKIDLEFSRYRLPAQDEKVERALKLRAEVAEKEATIYRESQAALEQAREEQQECLISHKEMSTLWGAKERQRLNADRMRLERARDHLRLDKDHTEAEKIELGKEITQQTEAFQLKKEELMLERGILQGEILALEAKLKELNEKEAQFTDAIKQQEGKIESVKMEFAPQQNALDKRQEEIEEREKTIQQEYEILLSTQKHFDEKTAEHCTIEEHLTEDLSAASEELDKSKKIIKELEEEQQSAKTFSSMEHFTFTKDCELARLHAKQREVYQKIKALSNKIQLRQRGVLTLRKSLNEIESQISDLDAAKEIAKHERNFKEAKRLKEESEALTKQGVESQGKLESLLEEITTDKKVLEKAEQENNDLETEIGKKERQDAFVTVEKACLVLQTLRDQINRIDGENLVKVLLQTEAKTCKNLISDLCNKHDIPIPEIRHSVDDEEKPQNSSGSNKETSQPHETSECESSEKETKRFEEFQDKLTELEGRLEAVVEVEDFDEADRLQQEITKLKEMMEERAGQV